MNVLIVPCGTEIGMEISRSLKNVKNITLFGANSIADHSQYDFEHFISGVPFLGDPEFESAIKDIVQSHSIDFIIPAHDDATIAIKSIERELGCVVVAPNLETCQIARSKNRTYACLQGVVRTPKTYQFGEVSDFPVFIKPDVGQGSQGAYKINDNSELEFRYSEGMVICEYLPGAEYTVDCFTDGTGQLLSAQPRERKAVKNGIAVSTENVAKGLEKFKAFAEKINGALKLKGAWFFQVKEDIHGELCLLEIAVRIAGSMALNRVRGINYAELSLYLFNGYSVSVLEQDINVSMHRCLANRYTLSISFNKLYCDFDDCLYINENKINLQLVALIYKAHNDGKLVSLITRHKGDLNRKLRELRISDLFSEIIHITDASPKSNYIIEKDAIFIDDSFAERLDVSANCGIPVFSVDAVESLLTL
ncbi:ATP-grasp domain-containing protein [Catenovulum agarivorans]|uniref:ATP-grasp domain-containing protein n=1 Tax=Catenovulum agarivorans TaxID=1172192 RepID=UPI000304D95E|nr:ATP-grasp domain-containing protein [Catenovulum agarivorans]